MCLGRTFSLEEGEVAGISDETEVGVSGRWRHRPSNLHIRHLKWEKDQYGFSFFVFLIWGYIKFQSMVIDYRKAKVTYQKI